MSQILILLTCLNLVLGAILALLLAPARFRWSGRRDPGPVNPVRPWFTIQDSPDLSLDPVLSAHLRGLREERESLKRRGVG